MSAKNVVEEIDDLVKINRVLVSVSDKEELEHFIPNLIQTNTGIHFYSTGGTFARIKEILEERGIDPFFYLTQVSEYTGQPETQGGLVKTLDFKIYLSLLTETYNDNHQADLRRARAVPIDMVVCNLYPFSETIAKPDVTLEMARGNIDIGGPSMIRAAAKNFIRVASVVDPHSYDSIIYEINENGGFISLSKRYDLATNAFDHVTAYDQAIANYLASIPLADVEKTYPIIH